ncbi:LptF/LptG family permease [bacterium]|nr:LptF/LptG family permease [bacterium]
MSLLFRLVAREMLGPFLFGLGAFTILFFAVETLTGVARMVLESKLGLGLIAEYLANRLPQVIIFTCPMAVLLSGLMSFGRLSSDSELTALKAAGISFMRIATPALLLCALVSCINLWLNDSLVPGSMKRAYDIVFEAQKRDPFRYALGTPPRTLKNGETQILCVYGFDVDRKILYGVYLHYFYNEARRRDIFAEQAVWNGRVWVLKNMRVTTFDNQMDATQELTASETWTEMQPGDSPSDPNALIRREYLPEELSRAELAEKLAELPAGKVVGGDANRKRNRYEVMFHQKLALPWTSLIFGAFAIPLGVRPQRSSRSIGLGLSLLFILIYYVLMTVGMVLGEAGKMPAMHAAWFPNIVFGVMGLLLLLEATRK